MATGGNATQPIVDPSTYAAPRFNYPSTSVQQQQPQQHRDMSLAQSSTIPGMSSGGGDPGPSTAQSHAAAAAQMSNFRPPPGQNPVISQQQMIVLQQMAQARGPNGQPQWSQQQLQMAMQAMQANAQNNTGGGGPQGGGQGGGNQAQAMMNAAMRGGAGQGQGGQGIQGQHQAGSQMSMTPQQQQQQQQQQQMLNNQRLQQLMAQQQQQQQQIQMGSPQSHGTPNSTASPIRPMSNMPPPSMTPQQQQQQQQQHAAQGPRSQGAPQLSLSVEQQQQFTAARNNLMSSQQFQSLPPQHQQMQLLAMQQNMMRAFAQQNGLLPLNPVQQQQQQQQQQPQPGSAGGQQQQGHPSVHRSDSAHSNGSHQSQMRQNTNAQPPPPPPPQSQHQQGVAVSQGQPLSSLPQHMAPRPGSAASHRVTSPHVQQHGFAQSPTATMNTTPPTSQHSNYPVATPQPTGAPSPAASIHSHHSHQTPQMQHAPSPAHMGTPTPQHNQHSSQHFAQMAQSQAMPMRTPTPQQATPDAAQQQQQQQQQLLLQQHQHQQQQQQQQLQQNMQAFAQGKPQQMQQQQQQQQPVQPPQPPQTAQPSGEADTSDFPFDFRLLHMIPALADPGWRAMIQTHQPQTFAAVSHAAAVLNTGTVPVDTLNRMKQMASLMRAPPQNQSGQQKPRSRPVSQHGTAPPNVRPPPPPATQPPVRPPIAQPVPRPQPPHLAGSVPPQSPAISDASQQSSRRQKDRKPEPVTVDPGMPPPAWIPTQPTPTTRPSTAGRDAVRGSGLPVKEWESALPLPLPIHTITTLPEEDPDDPTFGGLLPPLSQEEQKSIKNWIANDQAYAQKLGETKGKNREKMSRWARSLEFQTPWWEIRKGETPLPPRTRISILFPEEKMALRARARGRREVRFSPAQLKALANVDDQIIPVRIDLEQDHWKLKDTFMWNCADTVVTPELFAATLCLDFGVPEGVFGPRIVAAIREREREFQNQVLPILARNAMDGTRGKMDSEGNADAKATFEVFRRAREGSLPVLEDDQGSQMAHSARSSVEIKTEVGEDDERIKIVGLDAEVIADEEDAVKKEEKPMTVEEATATFSSVQSEDLRFLIKVDIILGTQNLTDTFEWDLNSVVTPEEFAALHVKELGLSGEFATALAHDIHEQILVHRRSLFLVGHMPGSGVILDDEVRSAFLPPITKSSLLRREDVALATFTPIFATMTEQEINEIEKDRDRDAKRKKRNTRGRRGVVLPDREPIKTHRTLINPMGPNGQLPVVSATEDVSAPVATTSRRAAAIAAQANISVLAQDLEMPSPPTPPAAALPTPSVFNKMSMRNSRPPTNRYSRGASRASPSSAREDSMVPNGEYGTPTMAGSKRSLYDDSVSESVGSPMPSRKRPFNGQFDSPDGNAFNVKMEAPYGETKVPWRCKNCGVPEHLSRGVKRDVRNGEWSLCLQCYRYYSKRRRPRPCTYTEDEETHRLRLENTGPGNPNGVPAGMPRTQQKPEPMSAPQPSPQQPPHFMGNGHGYAPPNHGYPPPQPMSFPDMSSGQTNPHHVPAHVQAPPAPVQPSQPPPPPQDSAKDPSQSPSDSDSDSESRDSVDTPPPPLSNKPFSTPGPPPPVPSAPPLSARSVSATSATMPSPVTSKKPMPDPPSWTNRAQAELRAKYPLDSFIIVPKLRPADQPSAPLEWRIKCTDCPGKVYTLGPGETLDNFEVHLRNRQHVEKRTAARAARGR